MTIGQKRARANQILREMGFNKTLITADNWNEDVIDCFLHFND